MGLFPLRYATASQEVPLGPFADSTDGDSNETGLTIANTDIKIWKTGATSEVSKNSGGATHIASGRYYTALDATDTNTLGPMRVSCHVSGALNVWLDCCVYPAAVYDALFLGSGNLSVVLASDYYHADIQFTRDQANTQDEWSVIWFKNGVVVSGASVSSPTIQLVKRSDGSDLQASTAMTQVGSTSMFKKDLTSTARVTVGEAVYAIVTASIDSTTRSFPRLIGRDSS